MKRLILSMFCCFALGFGITKGFAGNVASAGTAAGLQSGSSGSAFTVDDLRDGAPLPSTTAATATAATTAHDPLAAPAEYISDIKAAKRYGWAPFAFWILWQASVLIGRLSKATSALAFLNRGRAAVVIAALAALGLATYNALALGGSIVAALLAGIVAAAMFKNSDATALEIKRQTAKALAE